MIHLICQGKGGVGKTMISTLLAEHFGKDAELFDLDPVNSSFSSFKSFNVEEVELLEENRISQILVDAFFGKIQTSKKEHIVCDVGASTYLPLLQYLYEYDIFSLFRSDLKREFLIHVPLLGDQSAEHCLSGLETVAKYNDCQVMIWLNNYRADFEKMIDKNINEIDVVLELAQKNELKGIIRLNKEAELFVNDVEAKNKNLLSFADAIKESSFLNQHRLKTLWNKINTQIDEALNPEIVAT
jgi:hypothetical protein